MRGAMSSALRRARISAHNYPRVPKVGGLPSPAFIGMALTHSLQHDIAVELRDWQGKSGKLWREWRKLGQEAKLAMVKMGRQMMNTSGETAQ